MGTAKQTIALHQKHTDALKEIGRIAKNHLKNDESGKTWQDEIQATGARISFDEARAAVTLQPPITLRLAHAFHRHVVHSRNRAATAAVTRLASSPCGVIVIEVSAS